MYSVSETMVLKNGAPFWRCWSEQAAQELALKLNGG